MCFTCLTGEFYADDDYEIKEAKRKKIVNKHNIKSKSKDDFELANIDIDDEID